MVLPLPHGHPLIYQAPRIMCGCAESIFVELAFSDCFKPFVRSNCFYFWFFFLLRIFFDILINGGLRSSDFI